MTSETFVRGDRVRPKPNVKWPRMREARVIGCTPYEGAEFFVEVRVPGRHLPYCFMNWELELVTPAAPHTEEPPRATEGDAK